MNTKKSSTIAICLTAILALTPVVGFAQAATTFSGEAAGQSVLVSNPNVAISLPGGASLIVNEQTSSRSGNSGSITVDALHVKGPSIDIVGASAQSGITCS
jgi:hypothetical protein